MAEVVDATDLKSVDLGRTGSSPVARTIFKFWVIEGVETSSNTLNGNESDMVL